MHKTPGRYVQYDFNSKIWENDEDFEDLQITDKEFRVGLTAKLTPLTDPTDIEYRENLVCKLKKISDAFKLSDETFFRSVFLYDHQDRYQSKISKPCNFKIKKQLEDLFVFGTSEEEHQRKMKYVKFFEALAAMLVVINFVESDKTSPGVLDLLKYYWAEKLNLEIKDCKVKDQHSIDYKKEKIEILYDYVWEKKLEIMFKLDWKLQTVSVTHFLDHYKRLLPEVETFLVDEK